MNYISYPKFGIRLRIAFNGAGNKEIADKLGLSKSALTNYMNGRIPPPETLIAIKRCTNCSLDWLITGVEPASGVGTKALDEGEVPIYLGPKEHEIIQKLAGAADKPFEYLVRDLVLESLKARGLVRDKVEESNLVFFGDHVPKMVEMSLLGEIAAGEPIQVFETQDLVQVPLDFIKKGNSYFVLRVRGESMIEDGILNGALIVCMSKHTAKAGDTVVALIDGESATVKKYFPEQGRVRLQPANELHNPIFVNEDQLEIQGIVVGIFSRPA